MNRLGSLLASLLFGAAAIVSLERPKSDAAVGVAYSAMAKEASKDVVPAPPVRAAEPIRQETVQLVQAAQAAPLDDVKSKPIETPADAQSFPVPKPSAIKEARPITKEQLDWLQLIFDRKLVSDDVREKILVDANAISLHGLSRLQADGAIRRCLEDMKNPPKKASVPVKSEETPSGCSSGSCGVRTWRLGGGIF